MASEQEINRRIQIFRDGSEPSQVQFIGCYVDGNGISLDGWFSANDLRKLANAIDGAEDATRAMIHDLQEESTAYQMGVEEGERKTLDELMSCMDAIDRERLGLVKSRLRLDQSRPFKEIKWT